MQTASKCGLVLLVAIFFQGQARAQDPIAVVSLLLNAPSTRERVGEYLGLIESLDSKIDRLLDADLKTAVAMLQQVKANPAKQDELLTQARIYFTRAAAIQSDSMREDRRHKRAVALLGLWLCCTASDDAPNANLALRQILDIPNGPSRNLVWSRVSLRVFAPFEPLTEKELRAANTHYDQLLTIQTEVLRVQVVDHLQHAAGN